MKGISNHEVQKDSSRTDPRRKGRPALHGGGGDNIVPKSQRMTRSLMSYGKPVSLDMPLLTGTDDEPQREGKNKKGKQKTSSISTKSTKHQTFDLERVSKANPLGKKLSGRLTLEIDKKLQSVNRSVTEFEKTNQYVKGRVHSAVRRSEQDALLNRKLMSQRSNLLGMGDLMIPPVDESVYSAFMDEVEAELNKEELQRLRTEKASPVARIPSPSAMLFNANRTSGGSQEESRESTSDSDSSSVMKKTMTKFPSEISSGEQKRMTRPSYVSLDDEIDKLETETLGPIMPKLSDKAFLTNLKKHGGKVNENIQEMRNQIEAIKHKVEIDKRKADLKSQKLLYNPKKRQTHERIAGRSGISVSGTNLTDFIQAHGGTTGSWSVAEHDLFLEAFMQHRLQPDKLIATCQKRIPGKSVTEVMAHIKWYEQYISLTRANQDQLRKWDMSKRRDRQITYQMASEGQRTKLEDEKRRQEHLKNNREDEKLRSRGLLSQWKMRKLQGSGVFESKTNSPINFDELQKEMLDLAEKVQTISNPNAKKLKPPGNFPALSSNKRLAQSHAKSNMTQSGIREGVNRNVTVNLPKLQDNCGLQTDSNANDEGPPFGSREETPNTFQSLEDETTHSQGESSAGNVTNDSRSTKTSLPFPISHLRRETMSHKILAHSQKLKKMELSSQHTKEPDRYEECQLWAAPSSMLSGSRRAVPNWRKM